MRRFFLLYLVFVFIILVLAACDRSYTAPDLSKSPLDTTISPITISTAVFVPTPIPTPLPDKGSITGRFINYESREPIGGVIVYLGTISPFKIENSESHIITVLPNSSPNTLTDSYGYFAFLNVNPGVYAMIIWLPEKSWVVSAPNTGKAILIEVKEGKTTVLGDLFINPPR